ncbi:MAG TPA: M3 family oligoendopeptidase [Petrotogaceae bacterium]|nr:M3 family oligoendopeptidase [Petrotogaceae bacterium]
MKFSEMKYVRPDFNSTKAKFEQLIKSFSQASSFQEQSGFMEKINDLRRSFMTMQVLVNVRATINTKDSFYEEEMNFFDENGPLFEELNNSFYKELVKSNFRKELEEKWGKQLFALADLSLKTFSPEIINDLQSENKLTSKYTKLLGSAKIMFEGKERNLSQMTPFEQSPDRQTRKKAVQAKFKWFEEHLEEFDGIYDELVKVRDTIARKLGYKNFVQLGYDRLGRTDYNPVMVANYREQVRRYIVPMASKIFSKQQDRIGIDHLFYYDESFTFEGGNPKPIGTYDDLVKKAQKMYRELSRETGDFFDFMIENELFDLVAKEGKAPGGYCTFIPDYQSPFIFSNFNGTSGDVDVLTHEMGHAFQVYSSKDFKIPEYGWPTLEACEIHSMSMEFITWPWWELFYTENAEKARYMHLASALTFIPYGVSVDEFQHFVYENPQATPMQRREKWSEIEKKYLPHRDYDAIGYLVNGGFWQRQAHIYKDPFYYIDYTLAQVCAFQFWSKFRQDREKAWQDYVRLCRAGGSKPFTGLLEIANLKSPFENGCLEPVSKVIESYLDSIDDKKL